MELGDSDLFRKRWGREKPSAGFGEKGFAGAGWAREQDVVAAGDSNNEGAFGVFLAKNFVKRNTLKLIFLSIFDRKRGGFEVGFALEK